MYMHLCMYKEIFISCKDYIISIDSNEIKNMLLGLELKFKTESFLTFLLVIHTSQEAL